MHSAKAFNPSATLVRSEANDREFILITSFGVHAKIIMLPRERNVRAALMPFTSCCRSPYVVIHDEHQDKAWICRQCRRRMADNFPKRDDRYVAHRAPVFSASVMRWFEDSAECFDPILGSIVAGELAHALLTFIFSGNHFHLSALSFALPMENPAWS